MRISLTDRTAIQQCSLTKNRFPCWARNQHVCNIWDRRTHDSADSLNSYVGCRGITWSWFINITYCKCFGFMDLLRLRQPKYGLVCPAASLVPSSNVLSDCQGSLPVLVSILHVAKRLLLFYFLLYSFVKHAWPWTGKAIKNGLKNLITRFH